MSEKFSCPMCGCEMEYYEWPCVDPCTGDHLGNYRLVECVECGAYVDMDDLPINIQEIVALDTDPQVDLAPYIRRADDV